MKSSLGKSVFAGLFVSIACALMACSGSEGPTESSTSSSAATVTESNAMYYYVCSGKHTPCSEDVYNSASHEMLADACYTIQCSDADCDCPWAQPQCGAGYTKK